MATDNTNTDETELSDEEIEEAREIKLTELRVLLRIESTMLGRVHGWDAAVARLTRLAGERFAEKRDAVAATLRDLADFLANCPERKALGADAIAARADVEQTDSELEAIS